MCVCVGGVVVEWQVLLFDFQITQPSIPLTWRANKCGDSIFMESRDKLTVLHEIKQAAPGHGGAGRKGPGFDTSNGGGATKRDKCHIPRNN